MAHVFVSYAHIDADFVSLLKLRLEEAGFEVWIDHERLRAGDDWREGIDTAIRESMAVIAVMSPEAYESKYVTYEWAFAYGIGIKIIPVMLRRTDIHPRMDVWQYFDFTHHQSRPWSKLIERLGEVADSEGEGLPFRLSPRVPYEVRNAVADLRKSRNKQERSDAIDTLKQMEHIPEAIEALAHAVKHEIRDVRILAARALVEVTSPPDPRAASGLTEWLRDAGAHDIEDVTKALVAIKDRATVPLLREFLLNKDESTIVRDAAAEILGEMGDPTATQALIEAVRGNIRNVPTAAISALGKTKDPAAESVLIEKIRELGTNPFKGHPYEGFLTFARGETLTEALEAIGTPEALTAIEVYRIRRDLDDDIGGARGLVERGM